MLAVSEIDQQHQELVNILNRLNDAVKNYKAREDIFRIIDEVISYTSFHFSTEERLMVQYGYREIEAHKDYHKQLIQDALHLKQKLNYVGEEMFTEWFNHWPFARVLAHIQYADKHFEDHIIQIGERENALDK
ncbi:MAG: bacteriohemerythrin [Gallionellaceae bacterium]